MTKDTEALREAANILDTSYRQASKGPPGFRTRILADANRDALAIITAALATPAIGSHFGNGGGLDPAAEDVAAVEYGDAAQDAVMRLLERGVATVNSDGYLVLAHPPHPAPVDPVETLAQRQAREVMRPQSGSALAQPPFGQVYGMATKPVEPVVGREALHPDTIRLNALLDECWDLRSFAVPTGGDDADVAWKVVGHWMAAPHERVIAEGWSHDPRVAIDAALAALKGPGA